VAAAGAAAAVDVVAAAAAGAAAGAAAAGAAAAGAEVARRGLVNRISSCVGKHRSKLREHLASTRPIKRAKNGRQI
jgi:hypothetical protein